MQRSFWKIFKYSVSGGVAAAVNLLILYIFTDIAGLWYLYGSTVAYVMSFVVNFSLQKYWTFEELSLNAIPRQFAQFATLGLANVLLNVVFMFTLVDVFSVWHIAAQTIVIVILAALNFFVYGNLIFKTTYESKNK